VSRALTIALCQLRWSADPARNLDQGLALTADGFAAGADIVVLPELAVPGYTTDPATLARAAETLDGPTVRAWQSAAAAGGGYVVGGLCERDGDRLFDSAVLVSAAGVLGRYRKAHLFSGEKRVFTPGDLGFPVVSTPQGPFGICICYDLRFVEVLRILALQGAELVLVPSAWVSGFDRGSFAARSLPGQVAGLLVQANLNQVFVVAVSFAGPGPGLEFLGCSVAAGPYGDALAGPLPRDAQRVVFARVDLELVAEAARRTPLVTPGHDRRRDLYSVTHLGQEL
jgi:N-carbamoylputrescine amidase